MPSQFGAASVAEPSAAAATGSAPIESAFAHTLAHDMRTPLTAIQMCAEIIATRDDPLMRVRYATVIAEQAHSMAWALENLVALADQLDVAEGATTAVDLMAAARRGADDLRAHAEARSVDIVVSPSPDRLGVPGCEWAILQSVRACLQVLVALTPARGRVLVTGSVAEGYAHLRMTLEVPVGDASRPVIGLDLPWHRLSLLTAGKLIGEHGGRVEQISDSNDMGISVSLPYSLLVY